MKKNKGVEVKSVTQDFVDLCYKYKKPVFVNALQVGKTTERKEEPPKQKSLF